MRFPAGCTTQEHVRRAFANPTRTRCVGSSSPTATKWSTGRRATSSVRVGGQQRTDPGVAALAALDADAAPDAFDGEAGLLGDPSGAVIAEVRLPHDAREAEGGEAPGAEGTHSGRRVPEPARPRRDQEPDLADLLVHRVDAQVDGAHVAVLRVGDAEAGRGTPRPLAGQVVVDVVGGVGVVVGRRYRGPPRGLRIPAGGGHGGQVAGTQCAQVPVRAVERQYRYPRSEDGRALRER